MSGPDRPPRRLIVLGSTGSIGVTALAVVDHLLSRDLARFDVVGLAAGANGERLAEQAARWSVDHVAMADPSAAGAVIGVRHVLTGPDAAARLVAEVARPGDLVLGAVVGAAGVPAIIAAIECGCDVALANKETLVAAGAIVMPLAAARGVQLLPVDSEHSAIAQCLRAGRSVEEVERLVLTASGGPFRTWTRERIEAATVAEALDHPTWQMGRKITVDSASLMNKALEMIEAHWLFGLPAEKISAVIHPASIVHSFVEFRDGSVLAQLGPPDMRGPIQYALTGPDRLEGCATRLDWATLGRLEFEPPDVSRFPALGMAPDVIRAGGNAGAVFNAANEAAVEAFLAGTVPFGRIPMLVSDALQTVPPAPVASIDDVLAADAAARAVVAERLAAPRGPSLTARPVSAGAPAKSRGGTGR